MMRLPVALLLCVASTVAAQDTSFSQLRVRGSVFRNPAIGRIGDDWKGKTGVQVGLASNIGRSDMEVSAAHIGYESTTGKPGFSATFVTLGWTAAVLRADRLAISAGAQLSDYRMSFNDPAVVTGLREEGEMILSLVGRARVPLFGRYSAFINGSYGVLMLSTKTPMVLIHAGFETGVRMPDWLRGILR